MNNRIANCKNFFQGDSKKVLCVCSAGLLRSPTAAFVLSGEPFNFNTRAVGITQEYALIPVDQVLLYWADEIVCMEPWQEMELKRVLDLSEFSRPIHNLNVEDCYRYRDPGLVKQITDKCRVIYGI